MAEPVSEPSICFTVNDRPVEVRGPHKKMARLLDVLREDLGLHGTKEGCGEGECGACAVLIDGVLCNSCLVPAAQVAGRHVRTVEGLADKDSGAPSVLQRAFITCGAAQCGICTPGMLMAASALLARAGKPTEAEVRAALAGNLCRCTGYGRIIEAVLRAAEDAP